MKESQDSICEECYKKIDKYKYRKKSRNTAFVYRYKNELRDIFLDYKFNEKSYLYKTFSSTILKNKNVCRNLKNYDIITPVPISKSKYKKRGYNQSSLIAKEIAKKIGIDYKEILQKVKDNNTQSLLSKEERINNVKDSYQIKEFVEINKKIILFDDIYTTGATSEECKKVLTKNGYKNILIFCLFRD